MYVSWVRNKGDRRMIKYKRRTINQKAELHDEEFVTTSDATELIEAVFNAAVKAGADEAKLMEFLKDG